MGVVKISKYSFNRSVGQGSNVHDLVGLDWISFFTSLTMTLENPERSGVDIEVSESTSFI